MSDQTPDPGAKLSLDAARRLDVACNRFEAAWQEPTPPRVEDFLDGWEGGERQALVRELVALDIDFRRARGQVLQPEMYLGRFPELALAFLAVILQSSGGGEMSHPEERPRVPQGSVSLNATIDAPRSGGEYTQLTPHARGALGQVFRATDPELHRTVAVKCLQDRHIDNPDARRRFLVEAEVTARLEHPGIVPVYRLFLDKQGRPAYAMRFVEGQTLAEAITGYHAGPADPVAFRRLLQAFFQVCLTVAYAHGRGVIHRDLKPANVMLGPYGEALVVDWGLAKVVGRPEEVRDTGAGETLVPSSADSGSDETAMGSAVGTPAYMSPEQAAGRWDVIDQRSDVYGLGAVLYAVLTGQPPLAKGNWPEIQQKIQRGDFPRPRQAKPDTPSPLEAVCLKAMALDPAGRYPSAEALAGDVERWLADEPVSTWREPWGVQWGRWARRHKTMVAAAAALLVTAVVALSISTLVVTQAQRQTEEARKQESEARKQESAQRQRAENNFQTALAAVDRMLTRVGEKRLAEVPQMDEVRQGLLEDAVAFYEGFVQEGRTDPAVRREIGRAYQRTGRLRQLLGKQNEAEADYRQALDVQTKLTGEFPGEPSYAHDQALSHQALGDLCRAQQGRTPEAERAYQEALKLLTLLVKDHPERDEFKNSLAAAHNKLGVTYGDTDRTAEAESAFKEALRIQYELAGHYPKDPRYQHALAESYESLGDLYRAHSQGDRAEAEFKKAVDIREQLNRDHPKDPEYQSALAKSYNKLGYGYESSSRYDKAEEPYQKAFRIWDRLANEHPTILDYQTALALSNRYLGRLYFYTGRRVKAESHIKRSTEIFEELILKYPGQVRIVLDFANNADNIATLYREKDNYEEALPLLTRNVVLLQGVLKKEPRYTEATERLVSTYMDRAETFVRLERKEEASKDWDRMIELGEGQTSPHVRMYWAMALAHRGKHAQAVTEVESLLVKSLKPENAFYNFACVFSLSSAAVLEDAKLPAPESKRLAEQYAARSVELLMKARTDGYFKIPGYVEYAKTDTDLESLRLRNDFKNLIRQLEEDAKRAPAGERK